MAGHHPVGHGKSAPTAPAGWVDYWTDYYDRSRQLKKASQESWNATREVWKRKHVQARRIRYQKCVAIVKLWLRTYGYGPEKRVLKREHIPTRQDKKNKLLRRLTFSRVSRSRQCVPLRASSQVRLAVACQA